MMKNILYNVAMNSFCIVLSVVIVASTIYFPDVYFEKDKKQLKLEKLRKHNKELELQIVKLEILKLKIELNKTDNR